MKQVSNKVMRVRNQAWNQIDNQVWNKIRDQVWRGFKYRIK